MVCARQSVRMLLDRMNSRNGRWLSWGTHILFAFLSTLINFIRIYLLCVCDTINRFYGGMSAQRGKIGSSLIINRHRVINKSIKMLFRNLLETFLLLCRNTVFKNTENGYKNGKNNGIN